MPKKNKKNKGGRPTKYNDEIIQKLNDFFQLPSPDEDDGNCYKEVRDVNEKVQLIPKRLPTLERFAVENGLSSSTLRDWASATNDDGKLKYPAFSATYSRAREVQSIYIQESMFVGAAPTNAATFMLKNNHGWKDKQEQVVEHKNAIDLEEINSDLREAERIRRERREEKQALVSKYET